MRLRPDGALRVTVPRGGSRAEALRFAERHLAWAVRQRSRLEAAAGERGAWVDGSLILLDGQPERRTLRATIEGLAAIVGRFSVTLADRDDLRASLTRAMRAAAARELPTELLEVAAQHGLTVRRVVVRDQRSRWGSCSRSGTIALNYRLIQMPPSVRRYILVHELAHLLHADHSRRFWKRVESMDPGFRESERWLRVSGPSLF